MKIDILTLFPEICRTPLSESIMKRAQENGIIDLRIHNLRDWTKDKHHIVDDAPFGGGQGMVMKPEPIFAADDSFSKGLLETPQYTRPAEFRGWKVPDVLLSGNHAEIAAWRKEQALKRTRDNRPDLLGKGGSPEPPAADANTDHAGD